MKFLVNFSIKSDEKSLGDRFRSCYPIGGQCAAELEKFGSGENWDGFHRNIGVFI